MRTIFSPLVVLCGIAAPPAVASVLVVGPAPAPFPQISAAIASATDGDLVLVKTGTYGPFTVSNIGVVVVGDVGQSVTIDGTVSIVGLAAGKNVTLSNLKVAPKAAGDDIPGLVLTNCAGSIRIEACSIGGRIGESPFTFPIPTFVPGGPAVVAAACGDVAFTRSNLTGGGGASTPVTITFQTNQAATNGGAALDATASSVALFDCAVTGGAGGHDSAISPGTGGGGDGGDAATINGGWVTFSGGTVHGGPGGNSGLGSPSPGGDGGDGIVHSGGALIRLLAADVAGGTGGFRGLLAPAGADGVAFVGPSSQVLTYPGPARHFTATGPAREQSTVLLEGNGVPGDVIVVGLSPTTAHAPIDFYSGTLLLGGTIDFAMLAVLGVTSTQWSTPVYIVDLGPGVQNRTVHLQVFHLGPSPTAVIGPFSEGLLLDDSF